MAAATLRVPPGARRIALVRAMPPGRRVQVGWRTTLPGETLDAVRLALLEAARITGLRGEVLQRIAERESRLDPLARSGSSSATGLMQFTRDTWLEVVRDFGERHGLASEAAALQTDREGRITARDPQALNRILSLRENARYSAILAAERLRASRPGLEATLGRAATPADLYLIHLLGPTGSRNFLAALRANPQQTSFALLGERAVTNPGVFQRNGQSLTLVHAYAELGRMFEGPIQVAELRPTQPD
ncbi:MAG: transglycosylase SLT domain-containing protein [Pseudomonadota bacterium]